MKTTVEISDALLNTAREVARERGLTLRTLIEEGLRRVLEDDAESRQPFRLRRATFRGSGRAPGTDSWAAVSELIYP